MASSQIDPEDLKKIFEVMLSMRKTIMADMESLKKLHNSAVQLMDGKVSKSMSESEKKMMDTAKKEMEKMMNPMMAEHEEMMGECEAKMGAMDEKMEAHEKEMYVKMEEVVKMIPAIPEPVSLKPVEDKIKSLEDMLKDFERRMMNFATQNGRPLGGSVVHKFVDDDSLTGTKNDVNTTFTLSKAPVNGSLKLYRGGSRQRVTEDYTLSGKTVTFVVAPSANEILCADYRYF